MEDYKELESKNKQSIIDENLKLKAKLDKGNSRSEEELKQLEGQLNIKLKKELDNKYSQILKENYNLITESRNAKSSLVSIMKQYDKMKK